MCHFTNTNVVHNVSPDHKLPAMKIKPVSVDVKHPELLRFSKARPVPLPLRKAVGEQLDLLVSKGILSPVTSSSYASPVVWVKKKNGTLRLCADMLFASLLFALCSLLFHSLPSRRTERSSLLPVSCWHTCVGCCFSFPLLIRLLLSMDYTTRRASN